MGGANRDQVEEVKRLKQLRAAKEQELNNAKQECSRLTVINTDLVDKMERHEQASKAQVGKIKQLEETLRSNSETIQRLEHTNEATSREVSRLNRTCDDFKASV